MEIWMADNTESPLQTEAEKFFG